MQTYEVLCKTCGGTGFVITPKMMDTQSTTPLSEICPVCKGNKTQTVHETD